MKDDQLLQSLGAGNWDELIPLAGGDSSALLAEGRLLARLDGADLTTRLNATFLLFLYQLWRGRHRQNEELLLAFRREFGGPEASPAAVLASKLLQAMQHCLSTRSANCRHYLTAAEEMAQATGIHSWDHLLNVCAVEAAILEGNSVAVQRSLQKMAVNSYASDLLHCIDYHTLSAWHALVQGRLMLALEHLQHQLPAVQTLASSYHMAIWHLGHAQMLIQQGRLNEADNDLAHADEFGQRISSLPVRFMTMLTRAQLSFACDSEEQGLLSLREALAIGRAQGFLYHVWWEPRTVADLCARALAAGIEKDYVLHLVRERKLTPESPPVEIENWPWRLRIYTLGRFRLIIDNHEADLAGRTKTQKKPLELLKVLLALGGSAQENELIDVLWADSEGDCSRQTFKVNLHRLRKLLGVEGAIRSQDGVVTIDRRLVWTDVWAFENLFLRLRFSDSALQLGMARLVEKALNLYFGAFFSGEDVDWLVSPREKVKSRFLVLLSRLAQTFEQQQQWQKAAEVYLRGLEVEELSEDLYRRLMLCYLQAGCRGEALRVYQRCRGTLAAVAGLEPSAATESVLRRLFEQG